ncbi:MAG: hypothetical protein QM784_11080 [Polyangiaceae bacterium]
MKRHVPSSTVLFVGASIFFAAQMNPLEWAGAMGFGVFAGRALSVESLDVTLGRGTAALIRATVLLGLGYLWVAALGNQLDFSDVQVLVGLLGGAVPLRLPIVVVLTTLFYSAPVMLALCVWTGARGDTVALSAVVEATQSLAGLRLVFHLVSFTWGRMAWGSWEKQLLEVLLLVSWLHVIEFCSLYAGATLRTSFVHRGLALLRSFTERGAQRGAQNSIVANSVVRAK